MKKLIGVLFFIIAFPIFNLHAQDRHGIDSVQNQLDKYEAYKKEMGSHANPMADTNEVNLYYGMVVFYWAYTADTATYYNQKLLAISERIGYVKGIGMGYNGMGLIYMQQKNYAASEAYYQKALKVREDIGDKTGVGWTYNDLGLMYGNEGEYEESIIYHTKALETRQAINDKAGMAASYGKIGHCYDCLGKFPEAVSYYLDALKLGEVDSDKVQMVRYFDDIGNVYYGEGDYAEALKNYHNALKTETQTNDTIAIAYTESNIGRALYKEGNDTDAIKYMMASLKINKKILNHIVVADIYYNLSRVYLAMGNYPVALGNADSALKEAQYTGLPNSIANIYIEMGSVYQKMGRLQEAADTAAKGLALATRIKARVQMKEANLCLAGIGNSEGMKKIVAFEMNYAFAKKEDSIKDEEERANIIKTNEINRKSIITDSAIIISLLTLLMAGLLVRNLQLKRKKDKIIFEHDKQRMEAELANDKTMLDEYIQGMAEKNKLLEEFKINLEEFKTLYDKERTENLEYLNRATILTDEDWQKFKQLFEQVHKDFFKRLKGKLPDLTQAEIRLMCLTKLSVGTKQMAGILGVSDDTIKKSRHRLRKKLILAEDDSLDNFVNSI